MARAGRLSAAAGGPPLVVRDTGTAKGRGVFAGRAFAPGETVEDAPVVLFDAAFDSLPAPVRRIVFNWPALGGAGAAHAIALGCGSLYNHADDACLRYQAGGTQATLRFVAVRAIGPGEELTINYNAVAGAPTWPDDNWFDRMDVAPLRDAPRGSD